MPTAVAAYPDTVIGDQSATYHLHRAGNPFYIDAGTTISTSSGDGVDGAPSPAAWRLTNAGAIVGAASGVRLYANATVVNSGTIQGTTKLGVGLSRGGMVQNLAGGVISGAGGVLISRGGTISNDGSITGWHGSGVFMTGGGSVTNGLGGVVEGATNGIRIRGGAGTVTNDGSIVGSAKTGVRLAAGGMVTNGSAPGSGATISGVNKGVYLLGPGSVANTGLIQATTYYYSARTGPKGIGVDARALGAGDVAAITNSGAILGPAIGVRLTGAGGGSLDNQAGGMIVAGKYPGGGYTNASEGAYVDGAVTNAGTIASYSYSGLGLRATGSLDNQAGGLISAMAGYSIGVIMQGSLDNAGTIQASAYGAIVGPGSLVTNEAGGTITGGYWGVAAVDQYADVGIANAGLISGTGTLGVGVYLQSYSPPTPQGVVRNLASGTITGAIYGLEEEGTWARALINDGLISGGYLGITMSADGKVTNRAGGHIVATQAGGIAIGMLQGGLVLNQAHASIAGTQGIEIDGDAGTVINAGTINAKTAVTFAGDGANQLTLKTGSLLIGKAIGSTAAGATNELVLQGAGKAAGQFQNFDTLTVQATGTWTLDGVSTFGAASIASGALQVGDASHPGAAVTISGALDNAGVLAVGGGELDVGGAVTGAGSVAIAAGVLKFAAAFDEDVAFTGGTGELGLADSQGYGGAITGFSLGGGTSLDLGDIQFATVATPTYVDDGSHTGGVLTVTDGTHTAQIHLVGDFTGSTFVASDDGAGGTIVVDPAKAATAAAPAALHSLVAAMAAMDPGAGHWAPSPQSGRALAPLLAAPRGGG